MFNFRKSAIRMGFVLWMLGSQMLVPALLCRSASAQTYSPGPKVVPVAGVVESEKRLSVGGRVLDETGQPIEGVQVTVGRAETNSGVRLMDVSGSARGNSHYEMTDASGRWNCRHVSGPLPEVVFRLVHPDFASVTLACESHLPGMIAPTLVPARSLLDGEAVVFMKRGIPLRGVVLDFSGKPVEGAKIEGENFTVWTPVDGTFVLNNCGEGTVTLVVQAGGFAPACRQVQLAAGPAPIELRLDKSKGLRFRVTDFQNKPVTGAVIAVNQWEGRPVPGWHWRTDAEGCVNWNSAPAVELEFAVAHPDYEPLQPLSLKADGQEHQVKLRKRAHVFGTVVSAATGQAPAEFRIIPGVLHLNHYDWDWTNAATGRAGAYDFPLLNKRTNQALRVEAAGFYPEISAVFNAEADAGRHDFALKPGQPIAGEVRFPDGRAASAVPVGLCMETETVLLGAAKFMSDSPAHIRTTDEHGRFEFPPTQDVRFIAAVSVSGYGEISLAEFQQSKVVQLKPWGQISGTVQIGNRSGSNELMQLVRLGSFRPLLTANSFTALAGADGGFLFKQVPPGDFLIGRLVDSQFSHGQPVQVLPGETATVQLGKIGRRVIVHVNAADGRELDWDNTRQPAFLKNKIAPFVVPPGKDPVAEKRWLQNYWESPAGRARQTASVPYVLQFQSNNVFQADNVPAGDYECEIHYHGIGSTETDRCLGIARRDVQVVLPAPPADNDPLDLGSLIIQLK